MPLRTVSNTVIRQLQIVFSASILLLLVSLFASFYSTQQLIDNSKLVNHTNEVLMEAENIISYLKDAETGQRGYLLTLNPAFLAPYNGAYEKATESYERAKKLTVNDSFQQNNLEETRRLYEAKFEQMQKIIDMARRGNVSRGDTTQRLAEMVKGRKIMDDLRRVVNRIKAQETKRLQERTEQLQVYIRYTPLLLAIAAIISILITVFTYIRIKRDLDERIAQQKLAEEKYIETSQRISRMEQITAHIAEGDYAARSTDAGNDELGRISKALNKMAESLETTFTDLNNKGWLQAGTVKLSTAMRGQRELKKLSANIMSTIVSYLQTPTGTLYIHEEAGSFRLAGSHAALNAPPQITSGEGVIGQAIESKQTTILRDLPSNYFEIGSSLGNTSPCSVLIVPLMYAHECIGIIELGFLRHPTELEITFLETNQEAMAIAINSALDYLKLQNLLEETQAQSEELQAQHNELENLNTELEAQAQKLQASEEELRVQQEELQQTNTELEERSILLEEKNEEIQKKAEELELTTRYKSEFLANMSHELRTPLNSILLLSRLLSENTEHNLSEEQIEYAKVIQSSGNGLLGLIDEILDLSKIEAGQMTLEVSDVALEDIRYELQSLFEPIAKDKKLDFEISVAADVPSTIETDKMRLGQILKNLISNALKFTETGSVKVNIYRQAENNALCFGVKDTGIGIPPEKQPLIFEAFQQADGSTKRKYGGTGLGLSISRELAKLLGGEISLSSRVNQGSTFTLCVPLTSGGSVASGSSKPITLTTEPKLPTPVSKETPTDRYISASIPENIPDDRNAIHSDDKSILIIEDDTNFARSLLNYARSKGYKGIVAVRGDEGVQLATIYKPIGILLDIQLPVMSGWEVMDALKNNPQTRHIPVHMMSSLHLEKESILKGAIDFVDKPVAFEQMQEVFEKIEYVLNRDSKKVLIVEDNPKHAKALAYFLETFDISSELRSNISEGVEALKRKEVECVILDMGIPDSTAYDTLEEVKKNPGLERVPIIIFTGKSLSMAEELKIKRYADSIVVKTAHSYQRMLDEVSIFLHLVGEQKSSTAAAAEEPKKLGVLTDILKDKTVLVADDDVRNIFSLSKALENYKMNVVTALDGKEALQKLNENPRIDVVLLDMMMPQIDGYETAKKIRENYKWKNLPVIAVTAKAMTGDREKCIQAGASDYITKPVDIDQLISLLRVWLYEKR